MQANAEQCELFRCIVADPPWSFGDALPGPARGAAKHYGCLTVEQLKAFPLPPIADDAVLFLWRVAAMQREALDVAEAWGFQVKSELVWLKRTSAGKRWFGMGRIVRAEHETCLVCTRGRYSRLVLNHATRSTFEAPAGVHSEKPAEFFRIVEQLVSGPRAELFSRRERAGWSVFGNQVGLLPADLGEAASA